MFIYLVYLKSYLTFIGQTGRLSQVRYNSLWMIVKTLPHSGAGMGI